MRIYSDACRQRVRKSNATAEPAVDDTINCVRGALSGGCPDWHAACFDEIAAFPERTRELSLRIEANQRRTAR